MPRLGSEATTPEFERAEESSFLRPCSHKFLFPQKGRNSAEAVPRASSYGLRNGNQTFCLVSSVLSLWSALTKANSYVLFFVCGTEKAKGFPSGLEEAVHHSTCIAYLLFTVVESIRRQTGGLVVSTETQREQKEAVVATLEALNIYCFAEVRESMGARIASRYSDLLRVGLPRGRSSNPQGPAIFPSLHFPDRFWGPLSLLSSG
jgi:hypothetical protein